MCRHSQGKSINKVKGTGVRIVLWCGLDPGTRQFVLRGGWTIERGNLLCAGYVSNLRLRVPVFVVFCHGGCIIERGNFLCVGYASTRGYASNLILRVAVFGVLSGGILIIERGGLLCRWLHEEAVAG